MVYRSFLMLLLAILFLALESTVSATRTLNAKSRYLPANSHLKVPVDPKAKIFKAYHPKFNQRIPTYLPTYYRSGQSGKISQNLIPINN
jgi:hypothetical protein